MKKKLIHRKIQKLLKKKSDKNPVTSKIKSIVILNNPNSGLDIKKLKFMENALGLDSSDFNIFTVKEKKDNFNSLHGLIADASDLNIFGNIKNKQIKEFLNKKYDLLIDFTSLEKPLEKYFSLMIPAGFRVGYKTDDQIYDLMIEVKNKDIPVFIKEMSYYLKLLKMI